MKTLNIGCNLGDRYGQLARVRAVLSHSIEIYAVSSTIETAPLTPPNAPKSWQYRPFLNQAVAFHTQLNPHALLKVIKRVEKQLGRKNLRNRWAPREMDIDIITWDDRVVKSAALTIPHIGLQNRIFFQQPLAELLRA